MQLKEELQRASFCPYAITPSTEDFYKSQVQGKYRKDVSSMDGSK